MVLYGANGLAVRSTRARPEPNVEAEERVRTMLKSMDELLDIKWYPYAVFNQKYNDYEGRYALVCKWPQGDKRWSMFQSGEIEDPVDMFGWFCDDITDADSMPVAPDSIERKVLELLGNCDDNRIPHGKRMKQVLSKNAKLRQDRKAEMLDRAGEIAKDLHYISGHVEDVTLQRIMKEIAEEAKRQ
jgi:hypothetical protein